MAANLIKTSGALGLFFITFATHVAPAAAQGPSASPIRKGPYLQHLTHDSVDIRLETAVGAPATLEIEPPSGSKRTMTDSAPTTLHSFHVKDLEAATRYRYVARVAGDTGESGEFRTAPPDESTSPFEFIVYGDNRTDGPSHAAVVRAIAHAGADFLVHSGDFVQAGGEPSEWQDFFDIENSLLRSTCLFACVGNHELAEDRAAAAYSRYFGPTETSPGGRLYGSFRWANARFFLLNAFESWAGPERAWLEAELSRADSEANLAWRFVVLHHSPWSGGPHGDNSDFLAAGIDRLLVAHKVDLVIAGHDHIYERGVGPNGLKYLISGGGGAPLYRDIHAERSTRKIEATYNFVRIKAESARVQLSAERIDGSVIERCGFASAARAGSIAGGAWDCDVPLATVLAEGGAPPNVPQVVAPRSSSCGCAIPGDARGRLSAAPLWAAIVALVAPIARRRKRRNAGARSL